MQSNAIFFLFDKLIFLVKRLAYLRVSDPQSRDAEILRRVLVAGSINLGTLIEITCTRSSSELHYIKQQYYSRYQSDLELDISMKVSSGFKEVHNYYEVPFVTD